MYSLPVGSLSVVALSFCFSLSPTTSLIMTLVSRLTSPPRDLWLTLWLISGRSARRASLLFFGVVVTIEKIRELQIGTKNIGK